MSPTMKSVPSLRAPMFFIPVFFFRVLITTGLRVACSFAFLSSHRNIRWEQGLCLVFSPVPPAPERRLALTEPQRTLAERVSGPAERAVPAARRSIRERARPVVSRRLPCWPGCSGSCQACPGVFCSRTCVVCRPPEAPLQPCRSSPPPLCSRKRNDTGSPAPALF